MIGAAGYSGVEIWVSEIDTYLDEGGTLADLSRFLEDNSLSVPNLIAFFQWAHPDRAVREGASAEALEIFQTANALGCPFVAAPPAGITDIEDVSIAELADRYGALLAAAEGTGVIPILEFWGHSKPLKTLDEAVAVLKRTGRPEGRLLVDVFHMAKGASNIDLLGSLESGRVALLHVNDYPPSDEVEALSDSERVYPGDGAAPIRRIYSMLRGNGYNGMLSLELFHKGYQHEGAERVLRDGLTKMKNTFEPLGGTE